MTTRPPRLALFVDRMTQGGVQHSLIGLAGAFITRGLDVDLVIGDRLRWHDHAVPDRVETVILQSGSQTRRLATDLCEHLTMAAPDDRQAKAALSLRWRSFVPALARYLRERRPDAMLSAKTLANLVAILARRRAAVGTRLVISERNHLTETIRRSQKSWKAKTLPPLIHDLYPLADDIVAISNHVADDLAVVGALPRDRITTIHNGLLRSHALDLPAADHPWFEAQPPVILGAGRLEKQKDFPTLLRAFARVRAARPARLLIIGEGEDRAKLQRLAETLGVKDDMLLPGFQANPFAFMKSADLFVLSSTHEGFGNVLLEALAAGCPVVSTECPAGPSEILDGGRFGRLVPVGDADAIARAIETTLDDPPSPDRLRARAADFSMDRTVERYLACLLPARFQEPAAA